MQIMYNKQQ